MKNTTERHNYCGFELYASRPIQGRFPEPVDIFFFSRRKNYFSNQDLLYRLPYLLLESFEAYKSQRQLNGDIYSSVSPKDLLTLNKTIFDKTFASQKGLPSKSNEKNKK